MYESAQKEVMGTIRRDILPKFTAYLAEQTRTMCNDRRLSTAFNVCIDIELQVSAHLITRAIEESKRRTHVSDRQGANNATHELGAKIY